MRTSSAVPQLPPLLKDPFVLLIPLALFGGTILVGLILRKMLFAAVRKWAVSSESHLDILLRETLRGPIVLWSIILALHIATQNSEIPRRYLHYVPQILQVLWVWSLTVAASRFAGNAVVFYGGRVTGAQSVTSLTRKLVQLIVIAIGIVWLFRVVFDMSLTPVLTTLGVGGLAVALALQDTLSNLFAGFYVSISGLVRVGDYIKLNTGEEGYVTDITWRCTTMRTPANNLVVVPNNKLGQAIYTNYYLPEPRMGMSIAFNVGQDADIDRVQAILLEETIAATAVIPGLLADPAPKVLFDPGPGDSGLGFQVKFQITQFADQYVAQSELRKLLYKRLRKDGITMPSSTKTILLESKTPV